MKEKYTRFVRFNTNRGRTSGIFIGFKPKGRIRVQLKNGKIIDRDCLLDKVEIYPSGITFSDFTGKSDPVLKKWIERKL